MLVFLALTAGNRAVASNLAIQDQLSGGVNSVQLRTFRQPRVISRLGRGGLPGGCRILRR